MNGWISIYRKIQEHWIWQDEKYLKWWLTIILNVNHEAKKFPVGNDVLVCNPGQSFRSIEQWTAMFLCSKKTTVKFFEMLKNDDMIQCEIVGKGNRRKHLLTVVNWDEYQKKETELFLSGKPECSVNGNPNVTPNNKDNKENNENKNKVSRDPKPDDKIIDQVIELYHNSCESFPRVIRISPQRISAINTRIKEYGIDGMEKMFKNVSESDFLKGNNNKNWRPDIDWLLKPQNFLKVLEGTYKNKTNGNDTKRRLATEAELAADTAW